LFWAVGHRIRIWNIVCGISNDCYYEYDIRYTIFDIRLYPCPPPSSSSAPQHSQFPV
jgi:hypothetical protein